jgi:hypothetical protein
VKSSLYLTTSNSRLRADKPVEIFFLRIFFMISENLFKKNIFLLSAVETLFLEIPSLVSHVGAAVW